MSAFPTIPGYTFEAELGRGGMAIVYSAQQDSLGRTVAVKVVSADSADAAQHLERMENEARGLAALQHPSIVELYSFGRTAEGALYYVMPLLSGGSLADWSKPVPEEQLIPLIDSLLDALGHAHAVDIVHRDIKPENILFDRHARPMLADFGAALMRRRASRLTAHGIAIGSTGYMSPEQARGLEVDARSDLYSVAVLAFELLTGRLPFEGPDQLSIAIAQTEQPVPRLPDSLGHWQGFFAKGLAVNPDRRFAVASEMRAALHALRVAPTARRGYAVSRPILMAGCIVALAVVTWVGWVSRRPPVSAESIAALVAQGKLAAPDEPNAVAELGRARGEGLDETVLEPLRTQVLQRLGRELDTALQLGGGEKRDSAWQRWRSAVVELDAASSPVVLTRHRAVETWLVAELETALAAFDRTAATDALGVLERWPEASKRLHELAARVRGLTVPGDRLADDQGPNLVVATQSSAKRPGLAVMQAALDLVLYKAYLEERGLPPAQCASSTPSVQGCLTLSEARDIAAWVSTRTGHAYRVPTRDELRAAMGYVEPAQGYAWTSTCNTVRTAGQRNVAQKTWSGVRRLFGKPATSPRSVSTCRGHFALALDGRGEDARVMDGSTDQAALVLVRDVDSNPLASEAR